MKIHIQVNTVLEKPASGCDLLLELYHLPYRQVKCEILGDSMLREDTGFRKMRTNRIEVD